MDLWQRMFTHNGLVLKRYNFKHALLYFTISQARLLQHFCPNPSLPFNENPPHLTSLSSPGGFAASRNPSTLGRRLTNPRRSRPRAPARPWHAAAPAAQRPPRGPAPTREANASACAVGRKIRVLEVHRKSGRR